MFENMLNIQGPVYYQYKYNSMSYEQLLHSLEELENDISIAEARNEDTYWLKRELDEVEDIIIGIEENHNKN